MTLQVTYTESFLNTLQILRRLFNNFKPKKYNLRLEMYIFSTFLNDATLQTFR